MIGGNVITRLKEEIRISSLFDLVDYFVLFQGENALSQLCDAILQNKPVHNVPNIIYRDIDGNMVETKADMLCDPDRFQTPDFEGLPVGHYNGVNYLPLIASRGCYHNKCRFCSIPYGWGDNGYAGTRSPALIYDDMSLLKKKHNIHRFKFMDESMQPAFMRALSKKIVETAEKFEWEGYTRLEHVWTDPKFALLLSSAGFKKAYFGLEYQSSSTKSLINKNDSSRDIIDILKNCSDAGIKTHLFCMFGFPGTGRREAEETLELIFKNIDLIDTVDINGFTYSKHTHIAYVDQKKNHLEDWALEYDFIPKMTGVLSSQEIRKLVFEIEEPIWRQTPKLLHPTYRLISPWKVPFSMDTNQRNRMEPAFADII